MEAKSSEEEFPSLIIREGLRRKAIVRSTSKRKKSIINSSYHWGGVTKDTRSSVKSGEREVQTKERVEEISRSY